MELEILSAAVHGVFLAFGLIIPLGVQNVFVFNQGAVQANLRLAMPSVITASVCDTILIAMAVLGVSLLVLELAWLKSLIFIVGFVFLLYMGYVTWKSASNFNVKATALSVKQQIVFAMSVSLLNPHAIMDTIAVIGTNSIAYNNYAKFAYTISCITVSWLWFFGLAMAGHSLHKLDTNGKWIKFINKIAAIVIWLVALYIGWQLISFI